MATQPRGLHNFISDIRNAPNKEEERVRVDKELANIRLKFTSSSSLNSYQKKKYVWKMCYIYMLGYEVDFGHMEIISLLSSPKFQEKSVGYMGVALLLKPGDELMTLVVNSMRNDIVGNIYYGANLALGAVANIGGNDLAESIGADVARLVLQPNNSQFTNPTLIKTPEEERIVKISIRKKAVLCMLRLYRTNPESVDLSDWVDQFGTLLTDRDLGVVTSSMSLLLSFASNEPATFDICVPLVVEVLKRLLISRQFTSDYTYYAIPSPWLLVKCLRFLQYFRMPNDPAMVEALQDVILKLLVRGDNIPADSLNKSNAEHAILFETCNLVILYGHDVEPQIKEKVVNFLGKFIAVKDANVRYLGLEAMGRLVRTDGPSAAQRHQDTVITSLKDADVSVQKRALDLLFVMTDRTNCEAVVGELLLNLASVDTGVKDDMVVKIAILSEKFAVNLHWYLDTMVQVIMAAGDFVSEDVWHRIVQIITNNQEMQEYAAEKMMGIVQSKYAHEITVALAGYILGEFGVNICEKEGMSGYDQFAALHQHFHRCSIKVCALLLTSYVKIMNLYPDCKDIIMEVFTKHSTSGHLELQQRACEYMRLPDVGQELMENVLNTMPVYSANKDSALLAKVGKAEDVTDKSVWTADRPERAERPRRESYNEEDAPEAQAPPSGEVDLLSLDDDTPSAGSSGGGGSSAEIGLSPDVIPSMKSWFNAAVVTPAGQSALLYKDNVIQVTVTAEYRAHQGRIMIVFGNNSDEIQDLHAEIPDVDYLRIQRQVIYVILNNECVLIMLCIV
jgi:AP-2 complex subunit alpha